MCGHMISNLHNNTLHTQLDFLNVHPDSLYNGSTGYALHREHGEKNSEC